MIYKRNRNTIFAIFLDVACFVFIAAFVILAIYLQNGYWYFGVIFLGLCFFLENFRSKFVLVKDRAIYFRRYWIPQKMLYEDIGVIFITKYSMKVNVSTLDFHDKKTRRLAGKMFYMRDIDINMARNYHDSTMVYPDWSEVYTDIEFQMNLLEKAVSGGFHGTIYITDEMAKELNEELLEKLSALEFDASKFVVL